MSLYTLKKNTNIGIDKIRVVEQILDYVFYELKKPEHKEKFDKGEEVLVTKMWDSTDTSKTSTLFPEDFWRDMRTQIRPTTFITGSYNRFKKRHETYWLNGSAFNMAQFELSKEGINITNKTENKDVIWSIEKCEKVVYPPKNQNNRNTNRRRTVRTDKRETYKTDRHQADESK